MSALRKWTFFEGHKERVWPSAVLVTVELKGRSFQRICVQAFGTFVPQEIPAESPDAPRRWRLVASERERCARFVLVSVPDDDDSRGDLGY